MQPAGERNRRITIQKATKTTGANGEITETWSTLTARWASIEPLSGREAWQAKQVQATTSHKINLPYLSGLTTEHRISYGGRTFAIDSIRNIGEANTELEIMATERV